jgi:hypothetical protein
MQAMKSLAIILVTLVMVAACSGGATTPTGTAVQGSPGAGGAPAGQGSPTQAAGGGGGAIDACTVLSPDVLGGIVGTPVKTTKAGDLCAITGPNGNLALTISTVDATTKSAVMDRLLQPGFFQPGTTAQAVSGLGDKAVLVTTSSGVDLQVLKGSTFVDIVLTVTGQSADAMANSAKQLATQILAKT